VTVSDTRMAGVEALSVLSESRKDEIVILHESNRADWPRVSRRPELDILVGGAMGKASSFGLGLAMARPDRGVWILDGDGALLMNLGSLVTIAAAAPRNLLHVVYNNDAYDTTGGQPTPGAGQVNFRGLALDAGYPSAFEYSNKEDLERDLGLVLSATGPVLLVLKILSRGRLPAAPGLRGTTQAFWELHELLAGTSAAR
jgi:thiamine pyrophosphate-dependent acetolactate synthase large subunit-like protein